MQTQLNRDNFEKYFFYGMENKDEVVKWIIVNGAKMLTNIHRAKKFELEKDGYEKDKQTILELIVQLERFTSLHDDSEDRQYFYEDINPNSKKVQQMFNQHFSEIEKSRAISCVKYTDFSGIFFATHGYTKEVQEKYGIYSGEQYLNKLRKSVESAWGEDVFNILWYLNELEKENSYEYYSLFLDTKYARAINRNRTEMGDEREIHEIRNVYRKFLKRDTSIRS